MSNVVVSGSASGLLGIKVSKQSGWRLIQSKVEQFPDGELYVRVMGDVEGETVALIQSMALRPNDYLVEYLLMVDALRSLGARKILGVIPYVPYARQDARFNKGEALSMEVVAKLIERSGTEAIVTIDMHLHRLSDPSQVFGIPVVNLSAAPLLTRYVVENYGLREPVVIGPDEEAEQWAREGASAIDAEYDVMEKVRKSATEVVIQPKKLDVEGRDVIILDDIISTGGTMVEAVKVLKKAGARRIIAACTHPLLVRRALEKILSEGAEDVVGTDTVASAVSRVSVAPLIIEGVKRLTG